MNVRALHPFLMQASDRSMTLLNGHIGPTALAAFFASGRRRRPSGRLGWRLLGQAIPLPATSSGSGPVEFQKAFPFRDLAVGWSIFELARRPDLSIARTPGAGGGRGG